jgi:hypothetical protein
MRKPRDLVSGALKTKPVAEPAPDPFVHEAAITAAGVAGANLLGALAADREAQNVIAHNLRVQYQKDKEAAEDSKWEEILARRRLHKQMI